MILFFLRTEWRSSSAVARNSARRWRTVVPVFKSRADRLLHGDQLATSPSPPQCAHFIEPLQPVPLQRGHFTGTLLTTAAPRVVMIMAVMITIFFMVCMCSGSVIPGIPGVYGPVIDFMPPRCLSRLFRTQSGRPVEENHLRPFTHSEHFQISPPEYEIILGRKFLRTKLPGDKIPVEPCESQGEQANHAQVIRSWRIATFLYQCQAPLCTVQSRLAVLTL